MSLLDLVLADSNLCAAWQRVHDNNGAPGSDGVTLKKFGASLMQRLAALRAQVREGRYIIQPVLEVALARPGKSPRLLGIPAVRDRILQCAIAQVLTPVLDPHFQDASYGYRHGRSVAQAIDRVIAGRARGFNWVVDADIQSYFDTIPHDVLLARLARYLADYTLEPLIRQWLAAPVVTPSGACRKDRGVVQGSPLSPLLANLFLDPFDEAIMADPGRWLVRYADDFVILCRSMDEAERALEDAGRWIEGSGLALNFDKTRITNFSRGFKFLGAHFEGATQWAVDPDAAPWILPRHLRSDESQKKLAVSPAGELLAGGVQCGPTEPALSSPMTPSPQVPAAPVEDILRDGVNLDCDAPPLLRTVYITEPGAYLSRDGERLVVRRGAEELANLPLEKIDQILLADEGAISIGTLRHFMRKGISVIVLDAAGEPLGALVNLLGGNVELHRGQFERAADPAFCIDAARAIVAGKVANSRLLLRRYYRFRSDRSNLAEADLRRIQAALATATSLDALRGHEGLAARHYYTALSVLLGPTWKFEGRNRRPPRDPVNALLSYGYGVLFHNLLTLVARCGLDPYIGCLHSGRDRHPALVSDLMEEFRPLVVDSVVLRLLLNGDVKVDDFATGDPDMPCRLGRDLRREFLRRLEHKLDSPLAHPETGKTIDYRRAMLWQVSRWVDYVEGRTKAYRPLVLR